MPENLSTILRSTEPTVLTTGWGRTEGPLWHAEGSVTFVDLGSCTYSVRVNARGLPGGLKKDKKGL